VNHLGHFALTGILLPKLLANPGSRIVTVSSGAHKFGKIDFDDLNATRSYSRQARYGMSKLANLLFSHELERRLVAVGANTVSVACHPGASDTELSRHFPMWLMALRPLLQAFTQSPAAGALPTLRAATAPDVNGGDYYGPSGRLEMIGAPVLVPSSVRSRDPDLARRLWDVSVEMTGVEFDLAPIE
jgi:NAD(P)-dependent dehydrogenase (short-subunit alcohol dehydrogenase family)